MYFTGLRFGSILVRPVPLFTSMIWSRNKGCALEFKVGRGLLHLFFQFAQQFSEIEVAAAFLDDGGGDFSAAQDGVEAFLDGAPHGLRSDAMLFVVLHLLGPAVIGDRHQGLHTLRDGIGKENDFAVDVTRGASGGLDERRLAAKEAFLVGIEDADQRDFGRSRPSRRRLIPTRMSNSAARNPRRISTRSIVSMSLCR